MKWYSTGARYQQKYISRDQHKKHGVRIFFDLKKIEEYLEYVYIFMSFLESYTVS